MIPDTLVIDTRKASPEMMAKIKQCFINQMGDAHPCLYVFDEDADFISSDGYWKNHIPTSKKIYSPEMFLNQYD